MKKVLLLIVEIIFLGILKGYSKEVKDTIWTTDNDRIIISYDIRIENNKLKIQFDNTKKKLGSINSKRYKKLDEIIVLFFDKTGNYKNISFSNMIPEAFIVPSSLSYNKSDEGYFFMHDNPTLIFDINKKKKINLSIPIYLAHYEKKYKYKLFAVAKNFDIEITNNSFRKRKKDTNAIAITTTVNTEENNEDLTDALSCINMVNMLLESQKKLPFSDGLQYEIIKLRGLQDKFTEPEIIERIRETLAACEMKREELEENETQAAIQAQEEAERQAKLAAEIAKAKQDSIQAQSLQREKEEKKRNTWLIIGGILLGSLCIAGNQILQHFRNIKNQKNIMEMQQSIVRQAENDAKRRANSYVRNQTHKAINNTINKGKKNSQSIIKKISNKKDKGNFSI